MRSAAETTLQRCRSTTDQQMHVEQVPLGAIEGWVDDRDGGTIRHRTGRFFSIVGIGVDRGGGEPGGGRRRWSQPIISQRDVGILGVLVRRTGGGGVEILAQAKVEPGNVNGVQIAPTVQATSSNYSGVHGGRAVPYLERFLYDAGTPVVDSRQSEQGAWFDRKSNRNAAVEVGPDVEEHPGFTWLSAAEVNALLAVDDAVNMDLRTVLCCVAAHTAVAPATAAALGDDFGSAITRSHLAAAGPLAAGPDAGRALARARATTHLHVAPGHLGELPGWRRADGVLRHATGSYFSVIGVQVEATGREVHRWAQPMLAASGLGLVAFLACRVDGVLHLLTRLTAEPGLVHTVELGPTVQCTPADHAGTARPDRPAYLDAVLAAPPERVRFDAVQSDEGGRFFHTRARHVVVEVEPFAPEPGFQWLTLGQLGRFVGREHAVTVQARSLLACLYSLATDGRGGAVGFWSGSGDPR